jgi:hypothetical protein
MGGSGGGGGTFVNRSASELRDIVKKAEDSTVVAAFEAQLSDTLGRLLGGYNARDAQTAQERLEEAKAALEDELDASFDQLFGGSVAKHTYVDGLSDVDSLLLIDDSELDGKTPRVVLNKLTRILRKTLGETADISHGRMAVTIDYRDGMVIQLLPALKDDNGRVNVPSSRTKGWSGINPVNFQKVLTARNEQCAGKLVPTIKLAKAIVGQLPESQRLSGYHMESLAIAAFRGYEGDRTTSAMLPAFFEKARSLVLSPIRDSTGQSVHVDGYLGSANSEERQAASHVLGRIARRMRNATAAGSTEQWNALFGLDE